jgi:hypothetical protein
VEPLRPSPYAQALAETGVSTQAASRFQALSELPKAVFDEASSNPDATPTARKMIQQACVPQLQMPPDTLWILGRMRDFEREGFADKKIHALLDPMTATMRADVRRIAGSMADFFNQLTEAAK